MSEKYGPQQKYKREKVQIVRIELYGTDADIKAHIEQVRRSGKSVQGYIKALIRADMTR